MSSERGRRTSADLSSAAQEYLLALRIGSGDGGHGSAATVARKLGVSTQAASEMFKRLVADGLVSHGDGRDLLLTPAGRTAADGIFRRHALCEWLLTEVIGLGWAESDREAERLQAAISPRVEANLDAMLGHPETCPHGNPIDLETARRRPAGTPLANIGAGERATIYRITEEAEEDDGLLSYLEARGLRPGAQIHVLARSESLDSLTLDGPLGRATLGLRPAGLVRVLQGDVDEGLFHRVPRP
jgi:DtxR family Mn-dependent transcriptional regulator